MNWYFIYYADSNYMHSFADIESCFNQTWLTTTCQNATVYFSENHALHEIGKHLKNAGLRSSLIIQTDDPNDAMLLQLTQDGVIETVLDKDKPVLQMVLCDPDFDLMNARVEALKAIRVAQEKSRDEVRHATDIQRINLRLTLAMQDIGSDLSPEFVDAANVFTIACATEMSRIHEDNRILAKNAGHERKILLKTLLSHATFILK
jgi:hypothetical protein